MCSCWKTKEVPLSFTWVDYLPEQNPCLWGLASLRPAEEMLNRWAGTARAAGQPAAPSRQTAFTLTTILLYFLTSISSFSWPLFYRESVFRSLTEWLTCVLCVIFNPNDCTLFHRSSARRRSGLHQWIPRPITLERMLSLQEVASVFVKRKRNWLES